MLAQGVNQWNHLPVFGGSLGYNPADPSNKGITDPEGKDIPFLNTINDLFNKVCTASKLTNENFNGNNLCDEFQILLTNIREKYFELEKQAKLLQNISRL